MSDPRESAGMSYELAAAIEAAVYEAADDTRTVEPDVVAVNILAAHPDISVGWADLTLAVVETATRAGMGLRILLPDEQD
jgi:hypothetical protein